MDGLDLRDFTGLFHGMTDSLSSYSYKNNWSKKMASPSQALSKKHSERIGLAGGKKIYFCTIT